MAIHSGILDDGSQFQIMPHSRKIVVPETHKTIGTVGEHNSEQLTFKCPKVIDGHDVLNCASHYVSWMNASGGQGYDPVIDITSDEDNMYFKWVIPLGFTLTAGKVKFAVHFEDFDDDGELIYSWGSAVCEDCEILKGLNHKQTRVPIPDGYIKPEGVLEITENGEFDISKYATVVIKTTNASFILDGVSYAIISGITWGEWVRDASNPYFVDVGEGITRDGETLVYDSDGVEVKAGDIIKVGTYTSKEEGSQIVFYVDDVRYTVDSGTTWRTWTAEQSTYKIYNDYVMCESMYVCDSDYVRVLVNNEIVSGRYISFDSTFEYWYEVSLSYNSGGSQIDTLKLTNAPLPNATLSIDADTLTVTLQCGTLSDSCHLSDLVGKNITGLSMRDLKYPNLERWVTETTIDAGTIYGQLIKYEEVKPTFKIASKTYEFEQGMTWNDWVDSAYNTDDTYFIRSGNVAMYNASDELFYLVRSSTESVVVSPYDTIIANHAYSRQRPSEISGGSGGSGDSGGSTTTQVSFSINGTVYSVNVGSTWYDFYQKHTSMFTVSADGYLMDSDGWKYLVTVEHSSKCHVDDIIMSVAYIFNELREYD